ncbi:MAG: hypothetical protein V3S32_09555 [Acidimicrobiia bacterium]
MAVLRTDAHKRSHTVAAADEAGVELGSNGDSYGGQGRRRSVDLWFFRLIRGVGLTRVNGSFDNGHLMILSHHFTTGSRCFSVNRVLNEYSVHPVSLHM